MEPYVRRKTKGPNEKLRKPTKKPKGIACFLLLLVVSLGFFLGKGDRGLWKPTKNNKKQQKHTETNPELQSRIPPVNKLRPQKHYKIMKVSNVFFLWFLCLMFFSSSPPQNPGGATCINRTWGLQTNVKTRTTPENMQHDDIKTYGKNDNKLQTSSEYVLSVRPVNHKKK